MPNDTTLTPPELIPTYLAEGIPKQDESTLEDLQEYAEALIQNHDQAVGTTNEPGTDRSAPVCAFRREHRHSS